MAWQVQDAKARFSEFLDASLRDGPQIVTRHGVEAAVLVPIEEWRRLKHAAHPYAQAAPAGSGGPVRDSGPGTRWTTPPPIIDVLVGHECCV